MINKMWTAIGGAIAMFVHGLLTDDGRLSAQDWVSILVMAVGAFVVWYHENGPRGRVTWVAKFVASAWTAAGGVLLPAFDDGVVTGTEWGKIGVAAATALLVLLIPNKTAPVTDRSV